MEFSLGDRVTIVQTHEHGEIVGIEISYYVRHDGMAERTEIGPYEAAELKKD